MKHCRHLDEFPESSRPIVLAAGSFDGIHRGHQHVIGAAVAQARELDGEAWVLTFTPHPLAVINPAFAPPLITTSAEKREQIAALMPDGILELTFTEELAALPPQAFVALLTEAIPGLKAMVVGPDWRFGFQAQGCVKLLAEIGEDAGFEVVVMQPLRWDGANISSTRIRAAIKEGRFESLEAMLGRPYTLTGQVIPGRQVGRQLGFPTANIIPRHDILPPFGVYAVTCTEDEQVHEGAAYYGHRSAHPDRMGEYFFEVYLFDFVRDIYGKEISIHLHAFIRPDQHFDSESDLQRQIQTDTETVREILAERARSHG